MRGKVRVYFSQITFQPLLEEIAKYFWIASSVHNLSFHNLFYLVHNEVQDEEIMWDENVYLVK